MLIDRTTNSVDLLSMFARSLREEWKHFALEEENSSERSRDLESLPDIFVTSNSLLVGLTRFRLDHHVASTRRNYRARLLFVLEHAVKTITRFFLEYVTSKSNASSPSFDLSRLLLFFLCVSLSVITMCKAIRQKTELKNKRYDESLFSSSLAPLGRREERARREKNTTFQPSSSGGDLLPDVSVEFDFILAMAFDITYWSINTLTVLVLFSPFFLLSPFIVFLFVVFIRLSLILFYHRYSLPRSQSSITQFSKISIAHRGGHPVVPLDEDFPENSMAAYRWASTIEGADGIELDVWLSKDLVPMVNHDGYLERTFAQCREYISSLTCEQLKRLKYLKKNKRDVYDQLASEIIPTLEEVIVFLEPTKLKLSRSMHFRLDLSTRSLIV